VRVLPRDTAPKRVHMATAGCSLQHVPAGGGRDVDRRAGAAQPRKWKLELRRGHLHQQVKPLGLADSEVGVDAGMYMARRACGNMRSYCDAFVLASRRGQWFSRSHADVDVPGGVDTGSAKTPVRHYPSRQLHGLRY
jgi:hypothetical protein